MLIIKQLKIDAKIIQTNEDNEILIIKNKISNVLKIDSESVINVSIEKKSLDARKKPDLYWIYSATFSVAGINENTILKRKYKYDISLYKKAEFNYLKANDNTFSPIIIGAGPAGLFAAYYLVEAGFKPVIIERGKKIDLRDEDVNRFWNEGILDTESNVQFGEGGAGTFSDGKLNTGIKDKEGYISEVLDIFVKFGASLEIKYINKPHIGTDVLKKVITNMREYLMSHGVIYKFSTKLTDIIYDNNKIKEIKVLHEDIEELIPCKSLILAIGHSARDTFEMLYNNNIPMVNKPFAVGFRALHKQELINKSQYGDIDYKMPAADYKVTAKTSSGRGVYSFCMCPGGYVVNASSEDKRLCINGMSYKNRDSKTANSAIIITINEDDYGHNILDGMRFQRKLEENAFNINNGHITLQRLNDFNSNISTNNINDNIDIKGKYSFGNIRSILPDYMNDDISEAFNFFGKSIKGFDNPDTLLCGIEARTSSPIKIIRDDNCESLVKGLFPCGEGCGYAGGITSAAVDGLKVAKNVVKMYNNQGL